MASRVRQKEMGDAMHDGLIEELDAEGLAH